MIILSGNVPTPNQWLASVLKKREISTNGLAKAIDQDSSRLHRWIRGQEQIPGPLIAEIAIQIAPQYFDYALKLKDCENLADRLD